MESHEGEEVIQLTQEALKLANAACHFDNSNNYLGAFDYYDKCILNIDEVLNKLEPETEEWKKLLSIRTSYDDRMDFLREIDNLNRSSSHLITTLGAGNVGAVKSNDILRFGDHKRKKTTRFYGDFSFFDDKSNSKLLDDDKPSNQLLLPFWSLRKIKKTICDGGFINESLFVSKYVWMQSDAKLSGIATKSSAFQSIINIVTDSIESLIQSIDDISLELAQGSFSNMEEDLIQLQNSLAKPFPFIKEIVTHNAASEKMKENELQVDGVAEGIEKGTETSALPSKSSKNRYFSNIVSSIGKNVRKYAEVGYQRLVVAMPGRMSSEEMTDYTQLIVRTCDKLQVICSWCEFVQRAKSVPSGLNHSSSSSSGSCSSSGSSSGSSSSRGVDETDVMRSRLSNSTDEAKLMLETIMGSLKNICRFVKSIVIEILVHDLEYLMERYLLITRKVTMSYLTEINAELIPNNC